MAFSGFGTGPTGGNAGQNLFGKANNAAQPGTGGLFPTSTPSTSSPFGLSLTPTASGAFGSGGNTLAAGSSSGAQNTGGTSQQSLLGGLRGAASNPGSGTSTPNFFGSSTGNAPLGGIFGGKPPGTTATPSSNPFSTAPSTTPSSSGLFGTSGSNSFSSGNFSFGQKKDESGTSTPAGSTENKAPAATPSGGLFGNTFNKQPQTNIAASTNNASTSAPAGLSTPAPSKFFGGTSTTPAGPPPSDNSQASKTPTSLFGAAGQQIFAGISGTSKPADSAQTPTTSSIFSGPGNAGASLFNSKPSTGSGLFANLNSSTPANSGSNTPSVTTSSEAPKPAFSFGNLTSTPTTQPASTSAAAGTSNLFGGPQPTGPSAPAPAATTSNLFGPKPASSAPASTASLFGAPPPSTSTAAAGTSTSATPGGLFASLGGAPTSGPAASGTSAPSSTAAAPTSGLFGSKPTVPASTQAASSAPATSAPAPSGVGVSSNPAQNGSAQGLGASTAGPAPQLTRLKNKTMDEIITRWASDLSKYQKEFQEQAAKVASWDRLMVENGDKIQKLYLSTFEAERQSAEIERQLANVESQQDELASWLDRYETDVDEMFSRQIGQGEALQGPDQERERTYKLAEKLTDRLDDLGKNLTGMIEAINDASTTLSKTSKTDDPLSHIVRVLNSHLTQLQWIDENAMALQAKVNEAQKMTQSIGPNGYGGPESEAADSFYRSVIGKK